MLIVKFYVPLPNNFGSWKENEVPREFRRIFTVAFLLFLAPAGGSNPEGQSLTFT